MILQERAPGLLGWLSPADEVLAHARLADIDAELQEFVVNARCSPAGISAAHAADQCAYL
jgi:hypothetical protein